jgi:hypothetical protein
VNRNPILYTTDDYHEAVAMITRLVREGHNCALNYGRLHGRYVYGIDYVAPLAVA